MSRRPGPRLLSAALTAVLLAVAPGGGVLAQEPSAAPSPSSDPLGGIEILVRGERDPDAVVRRRTLAAVVDGNTAFAFDLYRELASEPGNLVLGPLSISFAMAMAQMGARGTTEDQVAAGMHFDLPSDRLAAGFDRLARALEDLVGPKVALSLVNQLFGHRGYPFEEPFLEVLGRRFGAPMAVVDYFDPEAVRARINAWVASRTNDRITDLVPKDSIDTMTRLVLVNATHLKADWASPFNAGNTEDRPFRLASGVSVMVPTMSRQRFTGAIGRGDGYRAIELPYDGGRLAMLIVVPDDLAAFQEVLTPKVYDAVIASLAVEDAGILLPSFSARTRVNLTEPLKALGITDIFEPELADLSGIGAARDLHVSAAVHQAFVTVAEQGTEASAATAIGGSIVSIPPPPFEVDRPFLWFIRDRDTGSVLFLGRVEDPRDTVQ